MKRYVFDSSALVKLFVAEAGSTTVIQLVQQPEAEFSISSLTSVEICSALRRLESTRQITLVFADRAIQQIDAELKQFRRIEVSDVLLTRAARIVREAGLRTLDAIQLATVLHVAELNGEPLTFVAADRRLLEAAQTSGLSVLNPEQADAL